MLDHGGRCRTIREHHKATKGSVHATRFQNVLSEELKKFRVVSSTDFTMEKPTENMSQPILTEAVGADAEQPNIVRDQPADAIQKVLTDMSQLHPARDQSPPGGAGSGQEGQEPGLEHPHESDQPT